MLRQNYSVGESENTYLILMEIHREIKIPLSYLFFCPKIQIVEKLKKNRRLDLCAKIDYF